MSAAAQFRHEEHLRNTIPNSRARRLAKSPPGLSRRRSIERRSYRACNEVCSQPIRLRRWNSDRPPCDGWIAEAAIVHPRSIVAAQTPVCVPRPTPLATVRGVSVPSRPAMIWRFRLRIGPSMKYQDPAAHRADNQAATIQFAHQTRKAGNKSISDCCTTHP